MLTYSAPEDDLQANAEWLIRLRWVAVVGQFLTISFVSSVFGVAIRWDRLAPLLILAVILNLALNFWMNSRLKGQAIISSSSQHVLGFAMAADLFLLTLLLYYTGGPSNPFVVFLYVDLCVSAFVLLPSWTWGLTLGTVVAFTFLVLFHVDLYELDRSSSLRPVWETGRLSIPQQGHIIAFATSAAVITFCMTRLREKIKRRDEELRQIAANQARSEKLEALGTLAAGAAHELATPLGTIAIVSKEVERNLGTISNLPPHIKEDLRLVRSELDRCRKILDRMSFSSGQARGEPLSILTLEELIDEMCDGFDDSAKVRLNYDEKIANYQIEVPRDGLGQALRGIVKNALDASSPEEWVDLHVTVHDDKVQIKVQDRGTGMPPEILRRISEPFFTTKEPGKGMGLGVFLAVSVIERLNGSLKYRSDVKSGTTATVTLPLLKKETNEHAD